MTENNGDTEHTTGPAAFSAGAHAARAERLPFVAQPVLSYPYTEGDMMWLGPNVSADLNGETIVARGEVYVRQDVADNAYSERNRLAALLAAICRPGTHIGFTDPSTPDYAVVIVETPYGQASWHIPPRDFEFFRGTPESGAESTQYDGHTTDEKYARLETMRLSLLADSPAPSPAELEGTGDRLAAEVVVDVSDLEGDGDLDELKARLEEALAAWHPTISVQRRRY